MCNNRLYWHTTWSVWSAYSNTIKKWIAFTLKNNSIKHFSCQIRFIFCKPSFCLWIEQSDILLKLFCNIVFSFLEFSQILKIILPFTTGKSIVPVAELYPFFHIRPMSFTNISFIPINSARENLLKNANEIRVRSSSAVRCWSFMFLVFPIKNIVKCCAFSNLIAFTQEE